MIKALLEQPESFHVRAVTRNPDSNQAKKLTEQDVDVVKGDLSDHSSLVQASFTPRPPEHFGDGMQCTCPW